MGIKPLTTMPFKRSEMPQISILRGERKGFPFPPTQTEKILDLFRRLEWVNNYMLNHICFRYSGRLHDLKKKGYVFARRHDGGSEWSWKLCFDPNKKDQTHGQIELGI